MMTRIQSFTVALASIAALCTVFASECTLLAQQYNVPFHPPAAVGGIVDWTSSFDVVYLLEEGTGTTRDNAGSCGANCDLDTESGTVNSTTGIEGTNANDFESSDGIDYLQCKTTGGGDGCDTTDPTGDVGMTYGCWIKPDVASDGEDQIFQKKSGNNGWTIRIETGSPANTICCSIGDGTDTQHGCGDASDLADATWAHGVCVHTFGATDEIEAFVDGNSTATAAVSQSNATGSSSTDLTVSRSSNPVDGAVDECFWINDVLTAAEICRICGCGIDGSACTCSGASYDTKGRFSDGSGECECASTDAGDCNAAAP